MDSEGRVVQKTDRRVRRTREALRDALLDLLPERGWDGIDVQSLCERADVGRSTFYLHYEDKTALLRGAFEDLRAGLRAGAAPDVLPGLLAHVESQRAVFVALLGRRSGRVVQEHFTAMLVELLRETAAGAADPAEPPWAAEARAHALAGALFQTLAWWLGSQPALPARAVEDWFRGFAGR
ncbi:MAG: hypothetical protein RL456_745 [Pseudomonadota bacterium]|jgi:AcrR family transcriptional regulator